jgi:hypothetical protein
MKGEFCLMVLDKVCYTCCVGSRREGVRWRMWVWFRGGRHGDIWGGGRVGLGGKGRKWSIGLIGSVGEKGVGHGPVDKAPGCCKVALGSNPRPSSPKMGSSKVDEQPIGEPHQNSWMNSPTENAVELALRNPEKKKKKISSCLAFSVRV